MLSNNKTISYGADSLLYLSVGLLFINSENKIQKASYSGYCKIFNIFDLGNDISLNPDENFTSWVIDDKNVFLGKWEDGTSFAAPLVTRKCAYLKHKYRMSINTIKAYINLENNLNFKVYSP